MALLGQTSDTPLASSEWDQPEWDGPPRASYLLCTTPRSGGDYMCGLLLQDGRFGVPYEYFDFVRGGRDLRARLGDDGRQPDLNAFLARLVRIRTTPNGVFGLAIHANRMVEAVRSGALRRQLPGLRFIYLRRDDVAAQAVSFAIARQTGQWTSLGQAKAEPAYDYDLITKCLDGVLTADRIWRSFFQTNRIAPLEVTFEGALAAPPEARRAIAEYVGVDLDTGARPEDLHYQRQGDGRNVEWAARYIEERRRRDSEAKRALKPAPKPAPKRPPTPANAAAALRLRPTDGDRIGTTAFFRNRAFLEQFGREIAALAAPDRPTEILVHACSIGAEVYSLAIQLALAHPNLDFRIEATDLSPDFVRRAEAGVYAPQILELMTSAERACFVVAPDGSASVADAIRARVRFHAPSSFVDFEASMTYDVVSLCNALVYVPAAAQAEAIDRIARYNRGLLALTAGHQSTVADDLGRNGYQPVMAGFEAIHDGWTDRKRPPGWRPDLKRAPYIHTDPYLAPIDDGPGWQYRHGALFRKPAAAMAA